MIDYCFPSQLCQLTLFELFFIDSASKTSHGLIIRLAYLMFNTINGKGVFVQFVILEICPVIKAIFK